MSEEKADIESQLKRALADYQNLQKRVEKEKADAKKFANEVLLLKLLGIVEGFEIVMKQIQDVFDSEGFEKVVITSGDMFDGDLMEAIDGEGTTVDAVFSSAYRLHGKVVKHARVTVTNNE